MTETQTIELIGELESTQTEMISEERRLDALAEAAGGCDELEYERWIELRDRCERLRGRLLEVIEAEPEGGIDSPALMALEMSDLELEIVELDLQLKHLDEDDIRSSFARGLRDGCEERIAELRARLDLLKVGGGSGEAAVVPAGATALRPDETEETGVAR